MAPLFSHTTMWHEFSIILYVSYILLSGPLDCELPAVRDCIGHLCILRTFPSVWQKVFDKFYGVKEQQNANPVPSERPGRATSLSYPRNFCSVKLLGERKKQPQKYWRSEIFDAK